MKNALRSADLRANSLKRQQLAWNPADTGRRTRQVETITPFKNQGRTRNMSGRLTITRARFNALEVDELMVRKLRVLEERAPGDVP
jgi:hypothetical protein